ncbi:unnamed protein product, partial [Musa banksii]
FISVVASRSTSYPLLTCDQEESAMEISSASSLLLLISFLCSAFFLFFKQRSPRGAPANLAALNSYPVVGNLPHLVKNSHRILEWTTDLIPTSPTGTVTVAPFVFTANPANVEHVSKVRFANYPKSEPIILAIRDCLGRGVATTNGEEWRLQRKAASHEFGTRSLRTFIHEKVCHELLARLVPLLTRASRSGEVIDLQDVLERFAFDNTCSLAFDEDTMCLGGEGGEEGKRFFHAFEEASRLCVERAKQPFPLVWRIKKWLHVGSERRLQEAMEIVHGFVDRCMQSRGNRPTSGQDLLSRFTADGANSDEFVHDNLISFVLAGRDTTPAALTWFFWILSSRPDVVAKIREETKRIRTRQPEENGGKLAFTMEELREMNYLHAAISESLRLYPPVPMVPRDCLEEDELPDGHRMRRGWILMYNAYAMGRREAIWGPDCREFMPERWLDEEGVFQPKSSSVFPVFHTGPRTCLGKDMAYIQMKVVAASILERFDMTVVEASGRHQLLMAMRMQGGLSVRLRERISGGM